VDVRAPGDMAALRRTLFVAFCRCSYTCCLSPARGTVRVFFAIGKLFHAMGAKISLEKPQVYGMARKTC
jgi:hypothetical protein